MDWKDKKLNYSSVANFLWKKKKILSKSRSNTSISPKTCPDIRCNCQEFTHFSTLLRRLDLEKEQQEVEEEEQRLYNKNQEAKGGEEQLDKNQEEDEEQEGTEEEEEEEKEEDYDKNQEEEEEVEEEEGNEEHLQFGLTKIMPMTPRPQDIEPCTCEDCLKQKSKISGIETREISSFRLVVQGPEILNYQGMKYSPADVAPYWKKDARMWLWKSVRLSHRQKSKSKSLPRFPVFSKAFKSQ